MNYENWLLVDYDSVVIRFEFGRPDKSTFLFNYDEIVIGSDRNPLSGLRSTKLFRRTRVVSQVLRRPALVLNRNWQPVNVASVARAITLVFSAHARVVEPDDFQLYDWEDWAKLEPASGEPFIQAVSLRLRVPEVISLVKFDRLPSTHVAFNRRNIFKRDRHACQYCGERPAPDELTIDHIMPRSQGGLSSWTNCVLACMDCNHRKANRTPDQAGLRLRRTPIHPSWNPIYWRNSKRIDSWQKFISDAYWNAELDD